MRNKVIVGNWKMNKTIKEAKEFVEAFDGFALKAKEQNISVGIAPSFLALDAANSLAKNMIVAAQNCHFKDSGAYTGDVSIPMLQEIGIKYCLIGHSERRLYSAETNYTCNLKMKALYAKGLVPMYCVGETLEEYEAGNSKNVVRTQVVEGLTDLTPEQVSNLVIAYEPVWSIGTGRNASKEIAQDICGYIREVVKELYSAEVADKVIIQYGGSVKPENSYDYLTCPDIDGVLVGGASLKPESFEALVSAIMKG